MLGKSSKHCHFTRQTFQQITLAVSLCMTLLQISDPPETWEQSEDRHKLMCGSAKDVVMRGKYVITKIFRK